LFSQNLNQVAEQLVRVLLDVSLEKVLPLFIDVARATSFVRPRVQRSRLSLEPEPSVQARNPDVKKSGHILHIACAIVIGGHDTFSKFNRV
jgi:hypothetical protein